MRLDLEKDDGHHYEKAGMDSASPSPKKGGPDGVDITTTAPPITACASTSVSVEAQPNMLKQFSSRSELLTARAEMKHDVTLSVSTVIVMGLLFGMFMNKSRVFEPEVIRDQFSWERMIMLKLFCAAGGTSCFLLAAVYLIWREHWECAREKNVGARNVWSTFVGGCLLGLGMALCGGCPGMVWVQVGSGVEYSFVTLAGCFAGALVYGLAHPHFAKYFEGKKHIPAFFDQMLKVKYHYLAAACGCCFFAVAVVMEVLFPWKQELDDYQRLNLDECSVFDCYAWHPIVCGVGIGVLQLPGAFILGNTLGSASAFAAVMGQWLRCVKNEETRNRYGHFKAQLNRWWQVGYVMVSTLGGFISTIAVIGITAWDFHVLPGVDPLSAFCGGFVMLFGARFAKGCTSGHGLSGTALMTVGSFVGVAGMFVGGTALMVPWRFA